MPAPIDIFIIAGQSNAVGRGVLAESPAVTGTSIMWTNQATTTWLPLDDPVYVDANNRASAWPAFGNAYQTATGVPVGVIMTAATGTGLIGGPWQGSTYGLSIQDAKKAMTALNKTVWTPTLRGVLWSQGENDAQNYPVATLRVDYRDALIDLIDRFQEDMVAWITEPFRLYVFRTGRPDSGDTTGFAAVRGGQDDADDVDADIVGVYDRCVEFPDLDWMTDDLHYNQSGYNDMGTVAGPVVGDVVYGTIDPPPTGGDEYPATVEIDGLAGAVTVGDETGTLTAFA